MRPRSIGVGATVLDHGQDRKAVGLHQRRRIMEIRNSPIALCTSLGYTACVTQPLFLWVSQPQVDHAVLCFVFPRLCMSLAHNWCLVDVC